MLSTFLAQIENPVAKNLSPKTGSQSVQLFGSLIQTIVGVLFAVGAITFFFMFLLGAIRWITSGGDKAAVEGARNQITHALIGLVILLAIFVIIKLIEEIFSVCILFIDVGVLKVGSPDVSNAFCGIRSDPGQPGLPPEEGGLQRP